MDQNLIEIYKELGIALAENGLKMGSKMLSKNKSDYLALDYTIIMQPKSLYLCTNI